MRFAQGKFAPELVAELTLAAADRDALRRAARMFVREVCLREGATHYQVLCVGPGAEADEIKRAYQLTMALIHPDRCDEGEAWPSGSAQRVNGAYAVISDNMRRRREYDRELAATRPSKPVRMPRPSVRPPVRKPPPPSRRAVAIYGLLALAFMAATFAFFALHEDRPIADSALLRGWTRPQAPDRDPSPGRPRFLTTTVSAAATMPLEDSPVKVEAPAAMKVEPSPTRPLRVPVSVEVPQPLARIEAPQAFAPVEIPMGLSKTSVQAGTAPAVSSRDIEDLAAKLVDSYEAGDTNRLLALFDARSPGEGAKVGRDSAEFFGATRERRLQLDKLEWRPGDEGVHARGSAVLSAQYADGRAPMQRNVDFELDVVSIGGHARIARLSVYPQGH